MLALLFSCSSLLHPLAPRLASHDPVFLHVRSRHPVKPVMCAADTASQVVVPSQEDEVSSVSRPTQIALAAQPLVLWLAYRHLGQVVFSWIGRVLTFCACLSLFARGLLDNNFYLPRGTKRMSPIAWPFRRAKHAFK